jgi:hypothetical protein
MTTEGGLRVPFVVMGPEQYVPKRQIRTDLVSMLDLTATTLSWAGLEQPKWYEGQDLFAKDFKARTFIGGQKDRLDHTIDRVRTVRSKDFRYVKNYKLDRILLQPQYRDKMPYSIDIHERYQSGKLSEKHREIYFGERQAEELYKVSEDPEMLYNLAQNPTYFKELKQHRKLLSQWLSKGDMGSDEEGVEGLRANGEEKKWGEGVNVEYEAYRLDSDGDGLSDKWEILNNRDPNDGLLIFNFDNGGWQTEGWFSRDIKSNLAGFLGYLDFTLNKAKGTLKRENLALQTTQKDKILSIKLKTDAKLKIDVLANSKHIGSCEMTGNDDYQVVEINLRETNWKGLIRSIDFKIEGKKGATIAMDYIQLKRQ